MQVLLRIARGQKLTEIGKALFISGKTVGTHRENILRKLGLANNADLVRFVIKHGLDEGGAK
jgi:DNA-binding NarL/FixJ family response regulator